VTGVDTARSSPDALDDRRCEGTHPGVPLPGNVRELQNVIERAVIVCDTDTLVVDESWLPREGPPAQEPILALGEAVATHEREMIEAALAESRGRVSGPSGAAVKLGIPASTLDSKIRVLKIRKDRFKGT
jgi:formate hydrogenlyase transcriptional activator